MPRKIKEVRHHHVDGSEYDEAILQQQLCAILQLALNRGYCMEHAREILIKHLADQIDGFCQEEPRTLEKENPTSNTKNRPFFQGGENDQHRS